MTKLFSKDYDYFIFPTFKQCSCGTFSRKLCAGYKEGEPEFCHKPVKMRIDWLSFFRDWFSEKTHRVNSSNAFFRLLNFYGVSDKIDSFLIKKTMHNLWKDTEASKLAGKCICAFCVKKNGGITYNKELNIKKILRDRLNT